jgi:hypothetical protein
VTAEILYDNAKVVALKLDREGIVFNEALLDFAGRYGFVPRVCKPYRPQTKGKVERAVRYIRDNFLEGESFAGLLDMQGRLSAWLDNVANQRIHATTKCRPIELFTSENLNNIRQSKKAEPVNRAELIAFPSRHFSLVDAPEVQTRSLAIYEEAVL